MEYKIDKIKKIISDNIKKEYPNYDPNVQVSQNLKLADLTTSIAFKIAKDKGVNPSKITTDIKLALKGLIPEYLSEIITINGFVNFKMSDLQLLENLKASMLDDYGKTDLFKGKTFEVEHTSPNPNKAMHLGHLRNNIVSMAITNIFEYNGAKVIRDAVNNNRGIAIAKLMWGYLKFGRKDGKHITDLDYWYKHQNEWLTPDDVNEAPDKFMNDFYVKGATDFKEDPDVEKRVRQMVVDWENEDKLTWELWKTVLKYVYEGQNRTLNRLASKWDKVWNEHEHYKLGKKFVKEGLKKGIFIKTPQGTIVTNLAKYNLPDTVVIKSDGTSLYITQDIALTYLKKKEFNADKMFWVIGPEQSLAMKQMFAVCDQLGIGNFEDFVHIAYGYMSIKGQGKMSSRAGNVIYIDDLLDEAKKYFLDILSTRDLKGLSKEDVAEKLAIAAVKYSILKISRLKDLAFDFKTSVSFEGNSGPYILYVYVRIMSIFRRYFNDEDIDLAQVVDTIYKEYSKLAINNLTANIKFSDYEHQLMFLLMVFPHFVKEAGKNYEPSIIADYVFKLAQMFTKYYDNVPVLKEPNNDYKLFKLALLASTASVIRKSLKLLGIETVNRM